MDMFLCRLGSQSHRLPWEINNNGMCPCFAFLFHNVFVPITVSVHVHDYFSHEIGRPRAIQGFAHRHSGRRSTRNCLGFMTSEVGENQARKNK